MDKAIAEGHAKRDEIPKLHAKLATSKQRKRHETLRPYRLQSGAGKVGTMKEWNGDRVVIDMGIARLEDRQAFLNEINK